MLDTSMKHMQRILAAVAQRQAAAGASEAAAAAVVVLLLMLPSKQRSELNSFGGVMYQPWLLKCN
jgi:hypothetical protein